MIAASAALLALGERTVDFGVPAEFAPVVSAGALFAYRLVRDHVAAR